MDKAESDWIDRLILARERNSNSARANVMPRSDKEQAYIAQWMDYRRALEVDDKAAEEAICRLYRWTNKESPDEIFWFNSPDHALVQVMALRLACDRRREEPNDFADLISTALICRLSDYTAQRAREFRVCCEPRWWRWEGQLHVVDRLSGLLFGSIHTEIIRGLRNQGMTQHWRNREGIAGAELGQTWAGIFAGADCMTDANNLAAKADIEVGANLARYVSFLWLSERAAVACRKPIELSVDEGNRPHNPAGPAIVFKSAKENWRCWCWHGTPVPQQIIEDAGSITISDIEKEINTEYRRILLERFGVGRYLQETKAVEIAGDEFGTLFRIEGEEPLVMLRVVNKTPEPNGEFKEYFLRVPPEVVSAREAVAWTFGMRTNDYSPLIES